jgi:hypothetical protein
MRQGKDSAHDLPKLLCIEAVQGLVGIIREKELAMHGKSLAAQAPETRLQTRHCFVSTENTARQGSFGPRNPVVILQLAKMPVLGVIQNDDHVAAMALHEHRLPSRLVNNLTESVFYFSGRYSDHSPVPFDNFRFPSMIHGVCSSVLAHPAFRRRRESALDGIDSRLCNQERGWIPACAGMPELCMQLL